jgi:hypothetical protein
MDTAVQAYFQSGGDHSAVAPIVLLLSKQGFLDLVSLQHANMLFKTAPHPKPAHMRITRIRTHMQCSEHTSLYTLAQPFPQTLYASYTAHTRSTDVHTLLLLTALQARHYTRVILLTHDQRAFTLYCC